MTENPTYSEPDGQPAATGAKVEVRRHVALSAGIGGFAALLTAAFAARAFTGGTGLDWLTFGVLAVVTVAHLASLVDGRAPLLVADEHGVRLRQGAQWRGIAWDDIDCLEHLPRRGLLRDGHLLVDGYDDQQLVVPLTLATRLVGASPVSLSDVLADLADGRADVVEVVPGLDDEPATRTSVPSLSDLYTDDEPPAAGTRRGIAARVAAGLTGRDDETEIEAELDEVDEADDTDDAEERFEAAPAAEDVDRLRSRLAHIRESAHPDDTESTDEIVLADLDRFEEASTDEIAAVTDEEPPAPGRATVLSARVEVPASVRPAVSLPVEPPVPAEESVTVVLDDLAVRPAVEPVIGPEVQAARDRLRLTIDQVSDRTRIRPHVIEAIEVDDFSPCGGDFYARGHLRTIARVLGIDAGPLVASYDERYAHEPVDPRRVFQSELATGTGGAIRSTRGGRNWSVMIAAVMGAVLIWSVARLVMGGGAPVEDEPLNLSGGVSDTAPTQGDPLKLTLTAAGGGATLNIRDGAGKIVFDGNLAFGQTSVLKVVPPIRIYSTDGSVLYAVGGAKPQALGDTGAEANKTVVAPRAGS